ncbi:MAG: hypothetical protein WC045_02705 [Patescibacteria group bacterium]
MNINPFHRNNVDTINRRVDQLTEDNNRENVRESFGDKISGYFNDKITKVVVSTYDSLEFKFKTYQHDKVDTKQARMTADRDRDQSQLNKINERIASFEAKIATDSQGKRWSGELAGARTSALRELNDLRRQLETRVSSTSSEISNTSEVRAKKKEELQTVANRIDSRATKRLEPLERQKTRLEEANKEINTEIENYIEQKAGFQTERDGLKSELDQAVTQGERVALRRLLGQIDREIAGVDRDIRGLKKELQPITTDMVSVQRNIDNWKVTSNHFVEMAKRGSSPDVHYNVPNTERVENTPRTVMENDRRTFGGEEPEEDISDSNPPEHNINMGPQMPTMISSAFVSEFIHEFNDLPEGMSNTLSPALLDMQRELNNPINTGHLTADEYKALLHPILQNYSIRNIGAIHALDTLVDRIFSRI